MSVVSRSCVYFHAGREVSTDTCSICLTTFAEGENLSRHTACNNKFHTICLFEWGVAKNIQGQHARRPLYQRHLYTFTTSTTRPHHSELRECPEVETVRLGLALEIVTSMRRITMSG